MSTNTDIDFNRIKHEKVRKLLLDNGLKTLRDLSTQKSLCYDPTDGKHYHKHLMSLIIDADIETAWNAYKTASPQDAGNRGMVSFGFMYSRKRGEIMYPGDAYSGIEEGQIFFFNLNLFAGVLNMAVGHEITGVDEREKTLKICYIQNGASTGTQLIQLKGTKEGRTEVVHETWYRSGSTFRDKVLYPGFHTKGLTEFHDNVKLKIQELRNQRLS